MADDARRQDDAQLREAISKVSSAELKMHMLAALEAFEASKSTAESGADKAAAQTASDEEDAVATLLRAKDVKVQAARDALFVAVHALVLETGFTVSGATETGFTLPPSWDANSASGLFAISYVHPNDPSIRFSLQGLFVGHKFEVYISDDREHTHSIELSVDKFVATGDSTPPFAAAGLLQNLKALRDRFTPFAEKIRPEKKQTPAVAVSTPPGPRPPDGGTEERGRGAPPPYRIPPVGGGDVFLPNLGGGSPDMLVGPNHPLFGHRGDPSQGPVPGARFDPFGPPIDPLGPSGFSRPPVRGPAATPPFGGPGPDHLRMPRDDEMEPGFGFGGSGTGRGGRGGGGFSQPFGSDHSFF